ncbi:cell envelope integrity protein TolA [Candidatus Fokinia crypta]|uniref:TolA domain protein n=1 Tax=Candidatus Fokinia crypta TaxID=1920990 RepID=A0ABZ0UNZ4_9RICK|nr:cell envelope integrity protein TolA [Candidatus Fokinia cryptica]WPX97856.1 Putative TolA domain protein [Candidatus Fokinia cryptica]
MKRQIVISVILHCICIVVVSFFSLLKINEEKRIQSSLMKMSIAPMIPMQEERSSALVEFDKVYQSVEERTFNSSSNSTENIQIDEQAREVVSEKKQLVEEKKQLTEEKKQLVEEKKVEKHKVNISKKNKDSPKKEKLSSKNSSKKEKLGSKNSPKKEKVEIAKEDRKKKSIISKKDVKKNQNNNGRKKEKNVSEESGFVGDGISDEEKNAIISQISENWYLDYHHTKDVMRVKVYIKVSRNGDIYDIKVVERHGIESSAYRKFVSNAISALENASPLRKLPSVKKYDEWKEMAIEFDSSGNIG